MEQKAPTLQDVARIAGVSTATVSRTLSNPNVVSESTRKRVADAVKESGYRINRAARNLRTQRAHSVLVLLPDLGNPFFSTILEGISTKLSQAGYSMLIASTNQVHDSGDRLVDYLDDARADAMIVLDGALPADVLESLFEASQSKPVVFACEWVEGDRFPTVRSENRRGTRAAVRLLHDLGHTKIGHIMGPETNVLTQSRRQAFISALDELDLAVRPDWIIPGDFSLDAGCEAATTWLGLMDKPTAVFCASDEIAFGFISELTRQNIHVPKDVSVMGFDDIDLAERFIPSLTTIQQDRKLIGATAANMVLERLNDENTKFASVVPVSLIVRESTARPKS